MKLRTLDDLFIQELKDLYDAEHQIIKALPKMAKAADSPDLRAAFEEHLEQTHGQVERLNQVFEALGKSPRGKKCEAMKGLLDEGEEMISQDAEPDARDAGLIAAAQKVEHYEIAGYGTARAFAEMLGHDEAESLLRATLDEEKATDEKLTELAMSRVNVRATASGEDEEIE
jgi:ferritin-like metal-binding protein YciE